MSRSAEGTYRDPSCPGPSRTQITCSAVLLLTLIQAGGVGPVTGLERQPVRGLALSPSLPPPHPTTTYLPAQQRRRSPRLPQLERYAPGWMFTSALTTQAEDSGALAVPGANSKEVNESKSSLVIAPEKKLEIPEETS